MCGSHGYYGYYGYCCYCCYCCYYRSSEERAEGERAEGKWSRYTAGVEGGRRPLIGGEATRDHVDVKDDVKGEDGRPGDRERRVHRRGAWHASGLGQG